MSDSVAQTDKRDYQEARNSGDDKEPNDEFVLVEDDSFQWICNHNGACEIVLYWYQRR